MYDLPEIRGATDGWWQVLAHALRHTGIASVPDCLTRDTALASIWKDPALVLTQTCGYPLKLEYADTLRAVAVPVYRAEGCVGHQYSSAIVVRSNESGQGLVDYSDRRFAANSIDSQSGFNCIRAKLAQSCAPSPFFATILWTRGHRSSLQALREQRADIAAIDAVTLALLRQYASTEMAGLKVIEYSELTPGLPYATRYNASTLTYTRTGDALLTAASNPSAASLRKALLIDSIKLIDSNAYEAIVRMHRLGQQYGAVYREQEPIRI